MIKRTCAGLMSAVLLLNVLGCNNSKVGASAPPPPPMVEVAPVVQRTVPVIGEWVGTLEGYVNAQIQPQVSGYLIRQDYHEGSFVRKGHLLFEIDPRPFQAALDQAIRTTGTGSRRRVAAIVRNDKRFWRTRRKERQFDNEDKAIFSDTRIG
jgi:multidrug efflux pump subunit AcrA (membrane-fusion protein)